MLAYRHAPRKHLRVGATLLVQARREAIREGAGVKAPVLTARPVLAGRYIRLGADGRVQARAPAAHVGAQSVAEEEERLRAQWAKALEVRAPGCVLPPPPPLERLFIDHAPPALTHIRVDGTALLARARHLARTRYPDLAPLIAGATHGESLFAVHGIEEELDAVIAGTVALGGGAFLRIEATDALTAIDVNSGRTGHGRDHATMARAVNEAAAREVARQLRLQDIGGLIVVDFLDVHGRPARAELEAAFDAAAADDRQPPTDPWAGYPGQAPPTRLPATERLGRRAPGSGCPWCIR
ncbi:MAG: hypothetical protein D6782_00620, partial [Alphaproteobacteria bacterium]